MLKDAYGIKINLKLNNKKKDSKVYYFLVKKHEPHNLLKR